MKVTTINMYKTSQNLVTHSQTQITMTLVRDCCRAQYYKNHLIHISFLKLLECFSVTDDDK